MGACKPLLPLAGRPVIRYSFDALRQGGVAAITVVVGTDGEAICKALDGLTFAVAWNREPESDMAASVRSGLRTISPDVSGVIIHLADYPLVLPETIAALLAAHDAQPVNIIMPVHKEQSGHPVLFPRAMLEEIHEVATLRDIVRRDAARRLSLEVHDRGILTDMDTPRDYDCLRENFGQKKADNVP